MAHMHCALCMHCTSLPAHCVPPAPIPPLHTHTTHSSGHHPSSHLPSAAACSCQHTGCFRGWAGSGWHGRCQPPPAQSSWTAHAFGRASAWATGSRHRRRVSRQKKVAVSMFLSYQVLVENEIRANNALTCFSFMCCLPLWRAINLPLPVTRMRLAADLRVFSLASTSTVATRTAGCDESR